MGKDYARKALNGTYRFYINGKNDMAQMEAALYLCRECGFRKWEAIEFIHLLIAEVK